MTFIFVNIYAQRIKLRHNKSGTQNEAIDRGFESQSGQAKDNKIGMCCFSAKNATLRRKSKDCLDRKQENVSEWGDMSIRGLFVSLS